MIAAPTTGGRHSLLVDLQGLIKCRRWHLFVFEVCPPLTRWLEVGELIWLQRSHHRVCQKGVPFANVVA